MYRRMGDGIMKRLLAALLVLLAALAISQPASAGHQCGVIVDQFGTPTCVPEPHPTTLPERCVTVKNATGTVMEICGPTVHP